MNRLGFKSTVFHGDFCLGEVEIFPTTKDHNFRFPNNEIRINYISPPGERCHPLSILQTISPFTVRCKLKSVYTVEKSHLTTLYFSCLQEYKTAIVLLGGEELHLVAMQSKQEKLPCFWCCSVPIGRYGSCLGMLNLRCLAIVFDLDETLIVANTMKSFEDRIDSLQKRLEYEDDSLRVQGMSAELRRYVEDRSLLKQYTENDSVMDNGKSFPAQFEEVQSLFNNQEKVVRPVIRLKERNIVLTRINPEIRDTSVLVRLRPAWEELRSYLNAKGRKRFEVYVCTMAERDYALEMWRLLDPEAHLISSNQLLNRVACVKSGSKKSLSSVFQDGMCHPKMAMVIDDRLKVWEDNDQPRVHVVPAFTPYYAPQAETASAVPVLFVARNVACNVRTGFFKEFDENILRRIFDLCYEDEVANLPYSPDVSDFLMSEDETHTVDMVTSLATKIPDLRPEASQQPVPMSPNVTSSEILRTNLPLHKSGLPDAFSKLEVHPSELVPFKRRKLIMQHGQNSSDPSLSRLPSNISLPIQSCGGWLVEDDLNMDQTNKRAAGSAQSHQNLPCSKTESIHSGTSCYVSEVKNEEAFSRQEGKKQNHSQSNHSLISEGEMSISQANKEPGTEAGKAAPPYVEVLLEIGQRCGSKIEFRPVVSTSKELQFSVEVLFTGDKIGFGMGKTKKDAQYQAAENALHTLAAEYRAYIELNSGSVDGDSEKPSPRNENGFLWDDPEPDELPLKLALSNAHTSEASGGATGGLKSFGTQDTRKRGNSPRPAETFQNKRLKGEFAPRSQIVSSQQHKNGNTVS